MQRRFLLAITALFLGVAPLAAQPLPPPPPFQGEGMIPIDPGPGPIVLRPVIDPNEYRIWANVELLVWWVKNAPMPITVTASNDPVNNPNGTPIGPNGDYGTFTGIRFALGGWLDTNNTVGIEMGFFATEDRSRRFVASSDGGGNPMLAIPFNSTTPGNEGSFILPVTVPGQFDGTVRIGSSLSLWGAEFNGLLCLARTQTMEFSVLAGFRYLELQEGLSFRADSESLIDGTLTSFRDNFNTTNNFYGGQLGARLGWRGYRLSFDITGKLAVGATHQIVDVSGRTVQFSGNSATPNVFPGGFFAQSSNVGRFTGNQFAIVPSVELKLGYAITPFWKVYVGYDFLYWTQVVRPGNQVDTNLNLNQSVILGNGTGTGPANPAPLFSRSDFWAQGLNFGLEFRY